MKRYEQHTMDHQHYAEAYSDAARWLQTNRERLSVCADTTGDRQKIQTQLEKLQVFLCSRPEVVLARKLIVLIVPRVYVK